MKQINPTSSVKTKASQGWLNGFIGMLIFSGSLPATKIAVSAFSPLFVTVSRATIGGVLALLVLTYFKEKRPQKQYLRSLLIIALGVVIGFPLLSALALQYITSAHSLVFLGLLPMSTALFGVFRGGERPKPIFWFFSILGSLLVVGFAISQGINSSPIGDILMLLAVILCGMGYAEGAKLSKKLGGWQVISWALIIALPLMIPFTVIWFPTNLETIPIQAWLSLFYIGVFCMFIGFIFWYNGLSQGGVAQIGQLQLLQPFFGLALAATLLHEPVSNGMIGITLGVILCVAGSKKYAKP